MVMAAAGACALAACVTAPVYGPLAESAFGYRDQRNADGSYTVLVVAPNGAMAHEFWDRRAGELCGGATYRKNIFRAEIPVVSQSGYAVNPYNPSYGGSYTVDAYGALQLEGYLHCAPTAADAVAPAPEG